MFTDHGITEKSFTVLLNIFKKYPEIHQVILYGSRTTGHYRVGSDIDITLIGPIDYPLLSRINNELEESDIPYIVDLSAFNSIQDKRLLSEIKNHGQVIFDHQS